MLSPHQGDTAQILFGQALLGVTMRANSFGLLTAASVALIMFGTAAQAQTNPFIPQSAASRAEIERVVDQKLKEAEERILSQMKSAASASGATGDGAPGAPVPGGTAVPGAPVMPDMAGSPGPLNPAGPNYPPVAGVPGDPNAQGIAPTTPPGGAVEQSNARFLGCINGTHKFTSARGRVTFTQAEINRAVKDGILPPCR